MQADHTKCPTIAAYRKDGKPRRENKFDVPCWQCGRPIPPGRAVVERRDGQWIGIPIDGVRLDAWTEAIK